MGGLKLRSLIGIKEIQSLKAEERTVVRPQGIVSIPNRDYGNFSTSDLILCYYSIHVLFTIKNFLSLIRCNFYIYILKADTHRQIFNSSLLITSQINQSCFHTTKCLDKKNLLKLDKLEKSGNIGIDASTVNSGKITFFIQRQIPPGKLCYNLSCNGIQTLYVSRVKDFPWLINCELYILFLNLFNEQKETQNAKPECRPPPDSY